ncbi:MAG TPA: helix-turn-helix transcriptional regulator, partial [Gemmatimonadales bacterium]|nr:helix-turn-helix transcriptional regulator [Gemmatimonadales bacterium]
MPHATPSRQGQARTSSHPQHGFLAPSVPPPPNASGEAGAAGEGGSPGGAGGSGNQALRELRLRRFWTQADFASAFEARSRQIGRPLSLSVRQVRRWESDNPPLPLPAYQAVLEALFGVPIERMGFQPQWAREAADQSESGSDTAAVPAPPDQSQQFDPARFGPAQFDPAHFDHAQFDRARFGLAETARTQAQWYVGPDPASFGGAGVTRSPEDDHERHDPVKRRQFMTSAVALGSGGLAAATPASARASGQPAPHPALPAETDRQAEAASRLAEHAHAGDSGTPGASSVDPALVAGYAVITAQHRALYWSVAASAMFAPVAAHSELGLGLLRAAGSPALRARLARPVAETALLAARLAFFDLQQPRLAEGYFTVALDAAHESADRALTGAVLAHVAFAPAFAGHARRARDLIAEAHRQAQGAVGAVQRSWMYAVESEVEARVGGGTAANELIVRAEGELSVVGGSGVVGDEPEWLDYYDASRLSGFKG